MKIHIKAIIEKISDRICFEPIFLLWLNFLEFIWRKNRYHWLKNSFFLWIQFQFYKQGVAQKNLKIIIHEPSCMFFFSLSLSFQFHYYTYYHNRGEMLCFLSSLLFGFHLIDAHSNKKSIKFRLINARLKYKQQPQ